MPEGSSAAGRLTHEAGACRARSVVFSEELSALRRGHRSDLLALADGDANWDADHPLKALLAPIVRPGVVLVDVHGATGLDGADIHIGTAQGVSPPELVRQLETLDAQRWVVRRDVRFAARRPTTVTSWAQARGAHAVQLELAAPRRLPVGSRTRLAETADALLVALRAVPPLESEPRRSSPR